MVKFHLGVVDDVVEARRPHEVLLRCAIDAGHLDAVMFGELHRHHAHAATCPVDQERPRLRDPDDAVQTLLSEHCSVRYRGGLLVGEPAWHGHYGVFARTHVLGEGSKTAFAQVPVYVVTHCQIGNALADGFDPSGYIATDDPNLRRPQTGQQADIDGCPA